MGFIRITDHILKLALYKCDFCRETEFLMPLSESYLPVLCSKCHYEEHIKSRKEKRICKYCEK